MRQNSLLVETSMVEIDEDIQVTSELPTPFNNVKFIPGQQHYPKSADNRVSSDKKLRRSSRSKNLVHYREVEDYDEPSAWDTDEDSNSGVHEASDSPHSQCDYKELNGDKYPSFVLRKSQVKPHFFMETSMREIDEDIQVTSELPTPFNNVKCIPGQQHYPKSADIRVSSDKKLRRSSRSKNIVHYREVEDHEESSDSNSDQDSDIEVHEASDSPRSCCYYKELNGDEYPSFVQWLRKSQVNPHFLMRLPLFSGKYLPKKNTIMTLETEDGEQYETKYLPLYVSLSGGWRKYAMDKHLVQGDAVVFQLIKPTRFKVYIIRKGSSILDLPTTIQNMYTEATQSSADKNPPFPKSEIHFNNISGFKHFRTIINELELPEPTIHPYYELCYAKNTFLHARLQKGLSIGTTRSIILNTVSIASSITTCTKSDFLANFSQWNKTLKHNESLGMNVGFLLARVRQLRDLAVSSEGAIDESRYMEACYECPKAESEAKKLDNILIMLRKILVLVKSDVKRFESNDEVKYAEACSRLGLVEKEIKEIEYLIEEFGRFFEHYREVIEVLKMKVEKHHYQFKEAVSNPW